MNIVQYTLIIAFFHIQCSNLSHLHNTDIPISQDIQWHHIIKMCVLFYVGTFKHIKHQSTTSS